MRFAAAVLALALIAFVPPAFAAEKLKEDTRLSYLLKQYKYEGVIVVCDKEVCRTSSIKLANQAYSPASTFKIANSLFALDSGVAPDESLLIKWDGKKRNVERWNRDHTMASAMEASALPYYQEISRRIGESRMKEFLRQLDYGNQSMAGGLDTFWVDGSLRISPMQQIALLKRLFAEELPFSKRSQRIVKMIIPEQQNRLQLIKGKTGWTQQEGRHIGWYVGWLEHGDDPIFFAVRISAGTPLPKNFIGIRRSFASLALRSLGYLHLNP